MTTIGAIFTSICHTKQLNPWPNSSASRVVIHSRLSARQRKMGPFKGYLSTHGCQTGLRKRPEWKQTVQLSAVVNTYPVGALMQLTDGDEKCVLKLCMYKTPFGKSGHICILPIKIQNNYLLAVHLHHHWLSLHQVQRSKVSLASIKSTGKPLGWHQNIHL